MKLIDRYIIKKYLTTFFFMLGMFSLIVMAIDFTDQMEDLLDSSATVWEIISEYYFNLIIRFANILSSILVFLTVIWVASNMAQKSELIAVLNGGVSFRRMLLPFMTSAAILAVLSLWLAHFLLPHANARKLDFDEKHMFSKFRIMDKDMHRELAKDTVYYFQRINASKNIGYHFSIEYWGEDGELDKKLFATKATFDDEKQTWQLSNVLQRSFSKGGEEILYKRDKMDTTMVVRISDFGERKEVVSTMDYFALNEHIEKGIEKGAPKVVFWQMEKHLRTANAFGIFVLTLIAFSLSSRKTRGGLGIHLALAVVIGLVFAFVSRMSTVAATNSGLDPLIASWIPNILFLGLGLWLYWKAPK